MGHWVYEFSGCPDTGSFQQIADELEPGEVVVRERVGGLAIVDGFVRESIDDVMMVARFRWVAGGDRHHPRHNLKRTAPHVARRELKTGSLAGTPLRPCHRPSGPRWGISPCCASSTPLVGSKRLRCASFSPG
jgi:hypothetical protein